jgi:hypothetical protein
MARGPNIHRSVLSGFYNTFTGKKFSHHLHSHPPERAVSWAFMTFTHKEIFIICILRTT